LNPSDSGREICKEAIFSPGNGISLRKNQLRARRTRRRARFLWLFCVGFSTNWARPQGRAFMRVTYRFEI